jgi:hypothetical protein
MLLGLASPAAAIEVMPTPEQLQAALERGKIAAEMRIPPDRLYSWFGATDELHPKGFLMTKLDGVAVMATHFHLRSATPDEKEIAQILVGKTLLVSVVILGETPTFAVDSYMVLNQNGRTVKPVNVRFDGQASRTSVWPSSPAYRAKVVASFAYGDFDPRTATKLVVFPSSGGEVSFDLDLARFE